MHHIQQHGAVSRATWRQVSAERQANPDEASIAWAIETAGPELVRGLLDDPAPFAVLAAVAADSADGDAQLALCQLAAVGGRRTRAVWRTQQRRARGGRRRSGRRRGGRSDESGFATAVAELRAGLAELGQQPAA